MAPLLNLRANVESSCPSLETWYFDLLPLLLRQGFSFHLVKGPFELAVVYHLLPCPAVVCSDMACLDFWPLLLVLAAHSQTEFGIWAPPEHLLEVPWLETGSGPGKKNKIVRSTDTKRLRLHAVFPFASFALESSRKAEGVFFYTPARTLSVGNYMTRFYLLATHLETKVAKRSISLEITTSTECSSLDVSWLVLFYFLFFLRHIVTIVILIRLLIGTLRNKSFSSVDLLFRCSRL